MSDFGTAGPATAMVIGAVMLAPLVGWWAVLTALGIALILSCILCDVNARFNPDGTRKRKPEDGRGKRAD